LSGRFIYESLFVLMTSQLLMDMLIAWIWLFMFGKVPVATAATMEQQQFPNVPFSVFSKFVEDHFISTASLSTVLMVLFTITENTDLLSLHFRQRVAQHESERSTSATGWIRCLGHAVNNKLNEDNAPLLKESDIDAQGSEKKNIITIGLKLDALARLLNLCPLNKSGKFKGKLKPVSHKQIQPIYTLCPNRATCSTVSCGNRALYQTSRWRDVPLVRLVKDFVVHEQVPVYAGSCNKCETTFYADHERSRYGDEGHCERVYINSARWIKIGQNLWVDRLFTSAVLSGIYTFHASAAAYADFWNGSFDLNGSGKVSRRQIWQAFVQESIRLIASASDTELVIRDGLAIDEVTKEAFNILGDNGIIRSADRHSCAECTQKYKSTSDIIPNSNVSDMVGMEEDQLHVDAQAAVGRDEDNEHAPVRMVVVDGIVMGHTLCSLEGCQAPLANSRGGVYCALHQLEWGGKCHAANCNNRNVQGTLACEEHQWKWRRHQMNHRQQVLGGYRRALRRQDETFPWLPEAQHRAQRQAQPHDEEQQVSASRDHFSPPRTYCVETICAPCGVVIAWTKFSKAESPTNILQFLQSVYPQTETRPDYICIDKACMILRTVSAHERWHQWLDTTRFIVDAYHYINHRATDELCRTWCNPAPRNGSAPNLVIAANNSEGQLYYKRAFNTQACEQLNAWLGGFENILKRMTAGNFDWFLHTMLFYHTTQVLKKRKRTKDEEEEEEDKEEL
jgi:hypothetical protein